MVKWRNFINTHYHWECETNKNLSKGVKHEKIPLCSLFLSHSFIIKG